MSELRNSNLLTRLIWLALILSALVSLVLARWSLAFVSFATLALSLAPPLLAQRWSLTLPKTFLLATTLFIVGSTFLGEAFDFYERVWWWDLFLHGFAAVGFGLFGFLFVFMLFEGDRFAAPSLAIAYISFCVSMMVGACWEIFEYGMDQVFGMNMQKSGLDDTMGDLIINFVGAVFASVSGYFYLKRGRAGLIGHAISVFIQRNARFYQRFKKD